VTQYQSVSTSRDKIMQIAPQRALVR